MAFKFRAAALVRFDKLKPASPAPDGSVWVKTLLW